MSKLTAKDLVKEIIDEFMDLEEHYSALDDVISTVVEQRVNSRNALAILGEMASDKSFRAPTTVTWNVVRADWVDLLRNLIAETLIENIERTDKTVRDLNNFRPYGP